MVIRVLDYQKRGIAIFPDPDVAGSSEFQPKDKDREQICYDLHVGQSIKFPGDDTRRPAPAKIVLKPNDSIRIESKELISVSDGVYGDIKSRASLAAEGLVAAPCKIDPKFYGKLVVTVYNTSKNRITVDSRLPFCSVVFFLLEASVPEKAPIRTPPEAKIISGNRVIEYLVSILPYIITFAASVIASLVAAYLFLWLNR